MRLLGIPAVFAASLATVAPAEAREAYIVKTPTIGCAERAIVQRLRRLREDDGVRAADAIAQDALDSGECTPLPAGMIVVEEDSDIVAGLTRVRAPGIRGAVWVRYNTLSAH